MSDLHANASALRLALADAAREGAERVVCLGDVVGYGPLPAETVALARSAASAVVAGNHDDAVSGRMDAKDFIDLAGDAVQRHRDALRRDDIAWLRGLPYVCELDGAVAAHGDFTDPQRFFYIESEEDAEANFAATGAQLMFVGHTHVPKVFLTGRSGRVYAVDPQDFTLECGKRYIVNPGSVGYPRERNGECRSTYVIYDSTERTVTFRSLPFAVSSVMQRGRDAKRMRRRAAAALALAAAAAAAAAAFALAPKAEVTNVVSETRVYAGEDPALVMESRTLTLGAQTGSVCANLEIRGDPVLLQVAFRDASGETLSTYKSTVAKQSRKKIKVSRGAVSATFSVSRTCEAAKSEITKFSPSF